MQTRLAVWGQYPGEGEPTITRDRYACPTANPWALQQERGIGLMLGCECVALRDPDLVEKVQSVDTQNRLQCTTTKGEQAKKERK